MEPTPPSQEQPKNGLPIISKETRDALLQELGLVPTGETPPPLDQRPTDQLMRDYIDMQTGKTTSSQVEKSEKAEQFALGVLDDIAESNPQLLTTIRDSINRGLGMEGDNYSDYRSIFTTPYARGVGVTFRAFHTQSDFKLIPDLTKLDDEDLTEIGTLIESKLKNFGGGRADAFTEALNRPRIPASQPFLREVIDGPSQLNSGMFGSKYKLGATVMYEAMGIAWNKLYPNSTSSQELLPPDDSQTPQTPPESI